MLQSHGLWMLQSTLSNTGTSVAALWRSIFSIKLDAMLRIGREMNAEHLCRKKFLIDLSHAIFVQHEGLSIMRVIDSG